MISVIVPTRNRAALLASALASVVKQDIAPDGFEVLVIDNGSTDDTQHVIARYKSQLDNLETIYAPEPGLHTGRHAGMSAAKGDVLVFADDDIEALPTWLSSIEEAFQDGQVAMVGGNNFPRYLQPPPDWLKTMWHRSALFGYRSIPSLSVIEFTKPPQRMSPYQIWGCNFAIRKDVLLAAGGFHPDAMPHDLIRFRGDGETHVSRYVAAAGLKCVFHPGASIYHKVTPERMTHKYFYQRGFNQGVSDSYTQLRRQDFQAITAKRALVKRVVEFIAKRSLELRHSKDVIRAAAETKLGYREGYAYHQAAYCNDPEVREWVHRPTYF